MTRTTDYTTPGFTVPPINDPANMTDAQRFFYEHAGTSWNPAHETPEQGRVRGARELAAAEEWARDAGLTVTWERDSDSEWFDRNDSEHGDWPHYWAALRDSDGDVLESLGGVMFADRGDETSDPYARVVAAELALEVMPV